MSNDNIRKTIRVIDSHTGGEPTRVVIAGGPQIDAPNLADCLRILADEHDWLRSTIINEPRGYGWLVGAWLRPPVNPEHAGEVIFFNNAGYLGMCGHGSIGVAVTLAYLGEITPGEHLIETPVGSVGLTLHDRHRVSIRNVASRRLLRNQTIAVPGIGDVCGDAAWGGNGFFLVSEHGQSLDSDNIEGLTQYAAAILDELHALDLRGPGGEVINHVELFGPPSDPAVADGKNFVLCSGGEYDRSPCGTGTSAKVACLIEDGLLSPGDVWRQEGITGSVFEVRARVEGGNIHPIITGSAFVTADSTLLVDADDPFRHGLPTLAGH